MQKPQFCNLFIVGSDPTRPSILGCSPVAHGPVETIKPAAEILGGQTYDSAAFRSELKVAPDPICQTRAIGGRSADLASSYRNRHLIENAFSGTSILDGSPQTVHVVGQDHPGVDVKRVRASDCSGGFAEEGDFVAEKAAAAVVGDGWARVKVDRGGAAGPSIYLAVGLL